MVVAKSSSHRRKYFKYNTSTAAKQEGEWGVKKTKKLYKLHQITRTNQLTSHAIVGETLTELIDHNEEDAYRVTQDRCLL